MPSVNWSLLWPEGLATALAFVIFLVDLFLPPARKRALPWLTALGLGGVLAFTLVFLWGRQETLFDGLYRVDAYALLFKVVFLGVGLLVALASMEYVQKYLEHPGEYYAILVLAVVGMMGMASAGELLTGIIALELESFALYVLVAYARGDAKSNEAAVKFILLGAFASALMLYGVSLVYGAVGTTFFAEMAQRLPQVEQTPVLALGLGLVLVGFGFKLAAVPFHMWAPDVYEGAPLPVTAFIAVASKAAVVALLLRFLAEGVLPTQGQWEWVLAILAALTMTLGNLVALAQRNLKRLLAYSSIGQVGYLLAGLTALSPMASTGVVYHLIGYAVTNLAAFGALIFFYNRTQGDDIASLAGAAQREPFVAMAMAVALFSLAGLPFFVGFSSKFYLFTAAAQGGWLWLAALGVVNSVISLYYYLVIIRQMYIERPREEGRFSLSPLWGATLSLLVAGICVLGVYPGPLVRVVEMATQAILP
ncbi:MAG: NADH-quinone oxidoreductase subunit N [Chloroflexota bacterium]|nr:NADH-quinone oxidoreductase subunit N [Chloroflexota bacterium]